nr:ribonuclease H-like domain-containing protein [Tanacetum cinerariifolium]
MLSPPKIQGLRKRSPQAPPKKLPNLNTNLSASLSKQRSQVIVLKNQACSKIKSSSRGTTMNNPLIMRRRIIADTRLTIMKNYDYGHLEEIEVRQNDQQLYTFEEVDFKRLRLQDIEYIRIVIQKRVEDLQLDLFKRKRLMRTDELHKFSDGTLNDVRTALHDIATRKLDTPYPMEVDTPYQYLQHEHYALWKVIEFNDSYKAPLEETAKDKGLAGEVSASTKKKGRTVAITAEDMQKRKNDVKARTTLLLALPDEHQLRFSKYHTAKELWEAILKTFGGNETTKKTKKNQLKQQYATQLNGYQIKYEDISQIDDDGIEEMDIKWNLALLSMRADSYMAEEDEASKNHAFVVDEEEVPTEYGLMAKSSLSSDNEMGLPEFVDDTVTNYTRPTPSIDVSKSISKKLEKRWKSNNPSFFEQGGSSGNVIIWHMTSNISYLFEYEPFNGGYVSFGHEIGKITGKGSIKTGGSSGNVVSKPMIKFVKESGCPNATKVNNTENDRKPTVKYAEMETREKLLRPQLVEFGNLSKILLVKGIPQDNIDDKGYRDSGCSRHMTGNISYLSEYEPFNGGHVSFGHGRGNIT